MSGILCCVVSRGTTVLSRYAQCAGNFSEICGLVLVKIPPGDGKMSYSHGEFFYHYTSKQGIITLAISDSSFDQGTVFSFLDAVFDKFRLQYGSRAQTAIAYAMNTEFSLVIANEMKRANTKEEPDKISTLQDEVNQVKDIMVANIDVIMERGEKLDLLVDKTENLSANSSTFRTTSRNLQRSMWWKNMKLTIGAAVGVVVFLYIIIALSCGGLAWQNCV
eukprot:GFUD01002215.1.p1 GENE.GFUD01002215.1~~GFUD01002215.1.p1  ORF type:complete len:220 (-),score=65.77 GFUD01002215.1:143-802(-)